MKRISPYSIDAPGQLLKVSTNRDISATKSIKKKSSVRDSSNYMMSTDVFEIRLVKNVNMYTNRWVIYK
jgi:hypothetical protein